MPSRPDIPCSPAFWMLFRLTVSHPVRRIHAPRYLRGYVRSLLSGRQASRGDVAQLVRARHS
jgi:hypothetical protein